MKEILIKGNKQYYLTKWEEIPLTLDDGSINWNVEKPTSEVEQLIYEHGGIRIMLARSAPIWGNAYVYYLYWLDTCDLDDLDQKVYKEENVDKDFEGLVVLEYAHLICLDGCKTWWHTLIMPRGTPFATDPSRLNWDKISEGKVGIKNCPICGSSFRQPVIVILGQAQPRK